MNTANISHDRAWTQDTLPVKLGRLGMDIAVQVAPSAHLDSLHASSALIHTILHVY